MSITAQLIAPVSDRWSKPSADGPAGTLGEVFHASHLLGSDRSVANFGGGNTSAKGTSTDHTGREVATMSVKGSGSASPRWAPATSRRCASRTWSCLFTREEMSDEDMVAYLARCQLDPAAPRSPIETLLHAFVPAAHVHHTHPDAINALACAKGGKELIAECFGADAAWIEYIRPGFTLARQVGAAVRENPQLQLVVLGKHGLVVWGNTAEEAYRKTITVINQAADFVNARSAGVVRFGGPLGATQLDLESRQAWLDDLMPALRGAVSSENKKILVSDLSPAATEFVDSVDAARLVEVGAACPDHLVHTKRVPLWIPFDPASESLEVLVSRITERAGAYRDEYRAYVERHGDETTIPSDPDARVVLIQGVGLVAVGRSLQAARISRDLYHRAIEVMAGSNAMSDFVSLTEAESFAVEYWPLELYKLSLAPPPGELQGHRARHGRRRRDRASDRRAARGGRRGDRGV